MTAFALIDCNNFFASCERVFNPALDRKPIVILSSNDGCVIARSNEAKNLGIPMGAPYYAWRELCLKNGVHVFSSNFELYSDLSHRIMTTLEELCPDLEIYSIDEAFLCFDQIKPADRVAYATHIRKTIKDWTGIPISVGLAPTKTLAKVANHLAKKNTVTGVFDLNERQTQNQVLANFPVENLWGVGRKLAPQLKQLNIHTALALRDANPKILRKQFSVIMEKLIQELQGTSCLSLAAVEQQKQIQVSRSFGKPILELAEIEEALSHYTANAAARLRQQHSLTSSIYVFLHTNLFSKKDPRYANSASCHLPLPSCDTRDLIHAAKKCLQQLYKPGYRYHKTGIILQNLTPDTLRQGDLFAPKIDHRKNAAIMGLVDGLHERWGKQALFFCAEGVKREWQVKSARRSPRYSTHWEELVKVK